jgi:hypothetical protein
VHFIASCRNTLAGDFIKISRARIPFRVIPPALKEPGDVSSNQSTAYLTQGHAEIEEFNHPGIACKHPLWLWCRYLLPV